MNAREPSGPLHRHRPPFTSTNGDIAAKVGADLGWDFDPEQRWLLDAIYAENDVGLPTSGDVAIVGPRQTVGKTATLAAAAIVDVVVFDVPLHVWTAHEFKTARKAFLDMRGRLESHPDYRDRVKFRDSHGEEAIYFESGGAIEFHARSGGSGRGFTTSRITLDEALFLRPGDLGALVPTGVTMPDFQVRYGSSAGLARSEALREIRNRGRSPQPGEDLAYLEFGSSRRACEDDNCTHALGSEGCALDDRDLWWQANSGLWFGRVTFAAMERQRRMLPPDEFSREFLSWWEESGAAEAFGAGNWEACAGQRPDGLELGGLAVAVSYDLSFAAIAAAGSGDGKMYGKPLQHAPGTGWVVERAKELQRTHKVDVVIDGRGPAADLIEPLKAAGVRLKVADTSDVLDAFAGIQKAVRNHLFVHESFPELDDAAASAVPRTVGDRNAWGRKQSDSDISPLEAVTLAAWAAGRAKRRSAYSDGRGLMTV